MTTSNVLYQVNFDPYFLKLNDTVFVNEPFYFDEI